MGKNRSSVFLFKEFSCSHGLGSMKIGVDAVLLGAWADLLGATRILDVGTGCGVIALMCAQRNPDARILAIDVDAGSVAEAKANFDSSPWAERLEAREQEFTSLVETFVKEKVEKTNAKVLDNFDLLISNPPYFNSGIADPDTPRLVARHSSVLSPHSLLREGIKVLSAAGRIAMVVPAEQREELQEFALSVGLSLYRLTWVKGHLTAPVKRVLLEFCRSGARGCNCREDTLILETAPGMPTPEHLRLCQPFYLKF